MIRRAAALLVGISVAAQTVAAATLELTRNSRSVTAQEAAGGAPLDGVVHDFYITSDADLLSLGPEIGVAVYQHPYGSNHESPHSELVEMFPALGASSFLRLPSDTFVAGGGFTAAGSAWADLSNDGPQSNFHFGRVTTTQSGNFAGNFYVRGEDTYITMPFSLSLPSSGEGLLGSLTEELSVVASVPTNPVAPDPVTPLDPPANPQPPTLKPKVDPVVYSDKSHPGIPVSVELTRRTRAVTSQELAEGAPNGYVHEFFITSSTDVIDIRGVAMDVPVYQHAHGVDNRFPDATRLQMFPGVSADSFLDTPGKTAVEGGFGESSSIWSDAYNNGPQDEFLFARLTVAETGHFSGAVSVAGPVGRIEVPFNFVMPGTAEDLALIDQEPQFSALSQIPEPSSMLLALAGLFGAASYKRRSPLRRKLRIERLEDRRVMAADFNADETVDELDLRDWKANVGDIAATADQGDADGDGDVDGNDFLVWQRGVGPTANNLIAYRPQGVQEPDEAAIDDPYYNPIPRRSVRAQDETSNTLGPGIRINGDDDNQNGIADFDVAETGEIERENDLIEIKVQRLAGQPDLVLVPGFQLKLYWDYDKETGEIALTGGQTPNLPFVNNEISLWVEWVSTNHGFANLNLVNPSNGATFDTVRFHSFHSLIVAFGGRGDHAADEDGDGSIGDPSGGPATNREGIFDVAQDLYNTGWDVLAFDEEEIDDPVENDPTQSVPYQEILSGHQSRFLDGHAVIGYSAGGGSAYKITTALYDNEELITRMVVYLDAVSQDGFWAEDRWPKVTFFTLNIYESVIEIPLNLGGADIDNTEPDSYGANMEEIDVTVDAGWNHSLNHFDIDDDPAVKTRIKTRLQTYLFEGR